MRIYTNFLNKMVSQLTNFCCGFSLKHGTIIIGVIQSIVAFTFLILSAAYAENPHELVDMADPSIVPDVHTLRCILITIAVASAMQCLFSILLIFGAETNRPFLLLPWLLFVPLGIAIYIIGTIVAIAHHSGLNNTSFIVGHLVIGTSLCVIAAYKILAVYSYYKHLKSLNF